MSSIRTSRRPAVAPPSLLWIVVSGAAHAVLLLLALRLNGDVDDGPRFQLPNQVEFGIADTPGTGQRAPAPPPAKKAEPKKARPHKPPPDPNAYTVATARPTPPDRRAKEADRAQTAEGKDEGKTAARSGDGNQENALGDGGDGPGDGNGYAPAGATIALNVDLERLRKTALLLETESLLDIIPEWQLMLAGSGLDPMKDFQRVFVATPNLDRASLVVAVRHRLGRERLDSAVAALAAERGEPAAFHAQGGYSVAPWRSRGPTERVIALTGDDQLAITRASDLDRVLSVAQSLAELRSQQGFEQRELEQQGGLLAMQKGEAVALWIEGVPKYVHGEVAGVPRSLRMSLYHVDQFNTELRVRGQYASSSEAALALTAMDALRKELSDHPRVIFLGLKSALDSAVIEQSGSALSLHVRLTLHQTRYLMRYVTRALRPSRA